MQMEIFSIRVLKKQDYVFRHPPVRALIWFIYFEFISWNLIRSERSFVSWRFSRSIYYNSPVAKCAVFNLIIRERALFN